MGGNPVLGVLLGLALVAVALLGDLKVVALVGMYVVGASLLRVIGNGRSSHDASHD